MLGFFKKKRIYFDYASATPERGESARAVEKARATFGNPGAIHAEGVEAKAVLENARERIALQLACKAREIIFVSGGTEANNLAILGFARKIEMKGDELMRTHWVTSSIEHPSVLECFADIERRGAVVTHVEPDSRGIIRPEALKHALRPETVFVSIQSANHEIGTIQPIRDISAVLKKHEEKFKGIVIFHSDMGQTPLYRSPRVHGFGVDIASFDSGKLYGPRGVGCVYLNNRTELAQVILGGGQERGLRAGTENVALAAGFAEALECISRERESESARIHILRDTLWSHIEKGIEGVELNGSLKHSLPHILNISVPNISSEYVTLVLDNAGIAISTKSACKEGEERRSHVVEALGGEKWRAANTLRFSLGLATTEKDVAAAARELTAAVARH
ncbi:MAG: cysteine desulfurase [Parcubacteria group bacterium Gr01-1014_8]|nr:MAG: cysteine desulfurase [Parcubacteria group bacterium Gr01-1014_8]